MQETIISDPSIMMGKPMIAGTRITVELILENLQRVKQPSRFWMHTLV